MELEIEPPSYFHEYLYDALDIITRDKEAGSRLIIAHYLLCAIKAARRYHNLPRLGLHSEVELKGEDIAGVGFLHGVVDFLVASIKGTGSLSLYQQIWAH